MCRLDYPTLHNRIEKLRTDLKMSQPEFAAALGMDAKKGRSTINNWESGANRVKDDDLKRIASTFHVSADWLLGLSEVKSPEPDVQGVCQYTGLHEDVIMLIKQSASVRNAMNMLGRSQCKDAAPVIDTPLFKFSSAFLQIEKAALLAAATVLSDDQETRLSQAANKMENLEQAIFRYERVCRNIPESVLLSGTLLSEVDELSKEYERKLLDAFIESQKHTRGDNYGEHQEN